MPTIVAALFAGYRVSVSLDNAEAYSRTGQVATLGNQLTALAHDVEAERDAMAERAAGGGRAAGAEAQGLAVLSCVRGHHDPEGRRESL
ncbi:hypothetical protein, partial [Actinomadura luteofluorescens]